MALQLQEQYGDDLVVVFVESQGHSANEIEHYALERKWFGGRALWTSERPVASTARGLPHFVMLDVDGQRVLEGNSIAMKAQIEAMIESQVALKRRGPADVPTELKTVVRDLLRDRFLVAAVAAEKVAANAEDDVELAARARAIAQEARSRATSRLQRIARLLDQGFVARAAELLDAIDGDVAADETLGAQVEVLRARLDSDAVAEEKKAERALARLEAGLQEKGIDAVSVRTFGKLIDKCAGSRAAARAGRYVELLGG